MDGDGCVISCTDISYIGERWTDAALKVAGGMEGIVTFNQKTFKPIIGSANYIEYAVFCTGDDEAARTYCTMAYIALNDAKTFYEEKHDRGTFVKNIIMDNILPGDIYIRAKELHFATEAPRAVFLVRQLGHTDVSTVDMLAGLFPDKLQDFVLSINESDIAVVKQLGGIPSNEELEKLAKAFTSHPRVYANRDWTKICAFFGKNAYEAEKILQNEGIYAEFCDGNALVFYLSPATEIADFERLKSRLQALFEEFLLPKIDKSGETEHEESRVEIFDGETEWIPLDEAENEVCAGFCGLFPPCTPLLCRGETISAEKIQLLKKAKHTFGLKNGKIAVWKGAKKE
jgi:hypothetical protein